MRNSALPLTRPWTGLSHAAGQIRRFISALELAIQVRSERRLLASLDEHALKDLGFNRGAAGAEADRSFWDLPIDRLRV